MILQLDENYKIESDGTSFNLYRKTVPKDETKEPYYTAVSYNNDLKLALKSYARYTSKEVIKISGDIKMVVDGLDAIQHAIEQVGDKL